MTSSTVLLFACSVLFYIAVSIVFALLVARWFRDIGKGGK